MPIWTLPALLLCAVRPAAAQDVLEANGIRFVHEAWTAADGLPVDGVADMIQSRDGYLWLATLDGLARFDGVRFTVFNSGNTPALPSNAFLSLVEDGDGRLWIRTGRGHLIERRGGAFIDRTEAVGGGPVATLHADPSGGLWVGTPAAVFRYADSAFHPVYREASGRSVLSLLVDSRDALWVGTTEGGLLRLADRGRGPPTRIEGLGDGPVLGLAEDPHARLWIGTPGRVYRLEGERISALPPLPEPGAPISFHFPEAGAPAWVHMASGPLAFVDGAWLSLPGPGDRRGPAVGVEGPEGALWTVRSDTLFRDGEPLLEIEGLDRMGRLLFDHEGTLWAAGRGLHRLRRAVIEQRGTAQGWVHNVEVVHEDRRGRLWFGSMGGGLVRLDPDGNVHRYPTDAGHGLHNITLAVHEDRNEATWVGLWNGGVCRLEGDGCAEDGMVRLGGRLVHGIFEDREGALWLGTEDGLFRRDGDGRLLHLTPADGLPHPDVRTFAEDRRGRLWMGTYGGGVARWDGERFEAVGVADGLSSPLVRSLHLDGEGVLWVGTEGRGLNRVVPGATGDSVAEQVTVYRTSDGLFDEGLHQILEDDFGRLWMSTNRGIFWVAKDELTDFARGRVSLVHSTSYTERDGLLDREMNGGGHSAGTKDRRGRLWFGGIGGPARIDPATIRRNEVPPPVVIEAVSADGRRRSVAGGGVALAAPERDFEIAYTALSFVAPENVRFRYRLEGLGDDWVEAGGRRTAFYTNVPPGRYVFRVVASNNDGVWNETGASLALTVVPFFHETWMARGAAALLLALAAFAALRYRERQHQVQAAALEAQVRERTRTIEEQAEQLRTLDRAKSRFFANISHEFRTPLTLTIGPLEDVREGIHGTLSEDAVADVELALESSRRLLRLVNQLLDVAKLEAGETRLRVAPGDLGALLHRLVSAFTPLAERQRVTLELESGDAGADLHFDPDFMEKVFTNLLSNALKFTPAGGAVRVTVERLPPGAGASTDRVRVQVRDSGPGVHSEDMPHLFERFHRGSASGPRGVPGTGIGLSLAKELVELHGGSIGVENEEGFGATFSVTLPAGKDHLPAQALAEAQPRDGGRRSAAPDLLSEPPGGGAARDPRGEIVAPTPTPTPAPADERDEDRPLVLVVDDNADVRSFVRRHLAPRFRVLEAGDGREALELATAEVPDLVLSDVVMAGMDGLDLLRALRADPELDFVPVVLLTARAEVEDRVRGLETGADDYLTKPFAATELVARVDNLIRSRARLRGRRPEGLLSVRPAEVRSSDERFVDGLRLVIEDNLSDEDFDVEALARGVAHSRSALYRRLADLGVDSPADLIRRLRLERAAQLLAGRAGSVGEIAYGVGFKSVSHFSRSFRERYGVTPSTYRDRTDLRGSA